MEANKSLVSVAQKWGIRSTVIPNQKLARQINKKGLRMFNSSATGRLESTWTSNPTTADQVIYQNLRTLVARSREQAMNNDHARKFLQMVRDNVAGPNGFKLASKIKDPTGTPDILASQAIEDAFNDWSKAGNYDVTGTLSRSDGERLGVQTFAKDGELIGIIHYGYEASPWGFAVEIVDSMTLLPNHYLKLNNGNFIRHGIEFNSFNRPVAYHFAVQSEDQMGYYQTGVSGNARRIPADRVIHCFNTEMVGQKRGLPAMSTALWRMRMLSAFEDSAVTAARVGASNMGFFRDAEGQIKDEEIPMDAEPGTFQNIGSLDFVPFAPKYPEANFEPFCRSMLRSIASSMGVSYNTLANDLTNVNFSSIRQGALDEREVWKGLQQWFIGAWCTPLFNKWIEYALLNKKIVLPSGKALPFEKIEKFKKISFRGRGWSWIDPISEVSANEKAVANGFKSRTQVIEEGGGESEDVWTQLSQDLQDMEALGIDRPLPNSFIIPQEVTTPIQPKE